MIYYLNIKIKPKRNGKKYNRIFNKFTGANK